MTDDTQFSSESLPAEKPGRTFSQNELNDIVGRAKADAIESYKRNNAQPQQAPTTQQNLSENDYRRIAAEELERKKDEWQRAHREEIESESARKTVDTYIQKIAEGKVDYEDFDTVTQDLDMRQYTGVVELLAKSGNNAAGVLYELALRRGKLLELEQLYVKNPKDAAHELRRLEKSIQSNKDASSSRVARAPLSQQRPSSSGAESTGPLSLADMKKLLKRKQ